MLESWVQDLFPLFQNRLPDDGAPSSSKKGEQRPPSPPKESRRVVLKERSPVASDPSLRIVHNRRAKRYLLRLDSEGRPILTIPRRGNEAEGLRFFQKSQSWLEKRLDEWQNRVRGGRQWREGTRFWLQGQLVCLKVQRGERPDEVILEFGACSLAIKEPSDYRLAILSHLRSLAAHELPKRVIELADKHQIELKRVTVRSQRTRWGSCSSQGSISLNWRLLQTPPLVVDYIIVHELMHRRHMNHSPAFWKAVEAVFPRFREAEAWLKEHSLPQLDRGL